MFNQYSTLMTILNKIADMVILSILWVLFCIPVLTIGASSAALYHTVVKVIRQERGYAFSTFMESFKSNLRQSIPYSLVFALLLSMFGATCYYCWQYPESLIANVYVSFSAFSFLVCVAAMIHCFALIGRFRLNRKEIFTLLVRLGLGHAGKNILILCVFVFAIEAGIYYPPLLFILPSGFAWICSYMQEPLFRKHISFEEEGDATAL